MKNSSHTKEKQAKNKARVDSYKKHLQELFDFHVIVLIVSALLYFIFRLLYSNAYQWLIFFAVGFPFVHSTLVIYEIICIYFWHCIELLNPWNLEVTPLLTPKEDALPILTELLKKADTSGFCCEQPTNLQKTTLQSFESPIKNVGFCVLFSTLDSRNHQNTGIQDFVRVEKTLFNTSPRLAIDASQPFDIGSYSSTKAVYPHSIMTALKEIQSYQYLFPFEAEKELGLAFGSKTEFTVRHWIYKNIILFLVQEISEVDKHFFENKQFHLMSNSPASRRISLPTKPQQAAITGFGDSGFGKSAFSFGTSTSSNQALNPAMPLDLVDVYTQATDELSRKMAVRRIALERYLSIVPFYADRNALYDHLKGLAKHPLLLSVNGDYGSDEVELDDTLESPIALQDCTFISGLEITDTQLLLHLIITYFDLNYTPNAPAPLLDSTLFFDQFYVPYGENALGKGSPYIRQLSPGKSHLIVVSSHNRIIYDIPRGDRNLFIALGAFAALAKKELPSEHALLRPSTGLLGLIPEH